MISAVDIKLIGFDLDDTLWPLRDTIQTANRKTWEFLCSAFPALEQLDAEARNSVMLSAPDPQFKHQISQARMQRMQALLQSAGATKPQAQQIAQQAMDVFLHYRHQLQFYPGAINCLRTLKKQYRLAAISNGNADVSRIDALKDIFDFAIKAEDIDSSKPEPDLFFAALQHFNCSPGEMLYIGDDLENDVYAAQACDIQAVWFNWNKQQSMQVVQHEVHNFEELQQLITRMDTASAKLS